jgi:hypothetical protein
MALDSTLKGGSNVVALRSRDLWTFEFPPRGGIEGGVRVRNSNTNTPLPPSRGELICLIQQHCPQGGNSSASFSGIAIEGGIDLFDSAALPSRGELICLIQRHWVYPRRGTGGIQNGFTFHLELVSLHFMI